LEVDIDQVVDICNRLGINPVTHLGLSSKELFHSNMLAWLFQQHGKQMIDAFGDLCAPDPAQRESDVRREWSSLDLVVRFPGRRALVVENKTFSLVDEDQLQRYSHHWWVQDNDPVLVLLSLGDPGWEERHISTPAGTRTWKWLPYQEVAKRLRRVSRRVSVDFDRALLERYCDVMDDLVLLANAVASRESDDSPVQLSDAVLRPLRQIRLSDGLLKLRTAAIARRIDPTEVSAGFTRGMPLLQAWGEGPTRWVGWQLQGHQFRLCAAFNDLEGSAPEQQRERSDKAKELADAGSWFDFSELERLLGSRALRPAKARPDRNGFNKYDPDFVYRYRLVPDLTQGELIELGGFYLRAARSAAIPQS
jgi:PD-(D/E)XK nuclease superfamily